MPTFSCRSTPFRISGSSQQRIGTVCSATRPSLDQTARRFGLFLPATVADALDGEKARRTAGDRVTHAADAGGQCRALVGDRSGGSAGTAKRVQNPSFAGRENLLVVTVVSSASRPQGRWSPSIGRRRTDRDALQAGTAAREERMHPQPSQRDRREWRDDPTLTNTSGRSHHVTVEGFGMRPTGFPSKDTDAHRPSGHA